MRRLVFVKGDLKSTAHTLHGPVPLITLSEKHPHHGLGAGIGALRVLRGHTLRSAALTVRLSVVSLSALERGHGTLRSLGEWEELYRRLLTGPRGPITYAFQRRMR